MATKRKFTQHFREYTCPGDTIVIDIANGMTAIAQVVRDDCADAPDKMQDGFWPSLNPNDDGYIGGNSKSRLARHMKRAQEFYDQWKDGEMCYCGIVVTISKEGIKLGEASLWGIDCNYPKWRNSRVNSYLRDVANELLPEALAEATHTLEKLAA